MSDNNRSKKRRSLKSSAKPPPPRDGLPLPKEIILEEILRKLGHVDLLSLASVCTNLRSAVAEVLPNQIKYLDLSALSPDGELLDQIVDKLSEVDGAALNCLSLDDFAITNIILVHDIEELRLLKGADLSPELLASIGQNCPNLSTLHIELAGEGYFTENLVKLLERCDYLEDLSVEVRDTRQGAFNLASIGRFLPKTLKLLKLHPVTRLDTEQFFWRLAEERFERVPLPHFSLSGVTLLQLSLVLNVISDRVIIAIAIALPNLVELHLEDSPSVEPSIQDDLTNNGPQSLKFCRNLKHLSLVRSQVKFQVSFTRFDDVGLILLSQSCGRLESIELGGFSRVTDVGFSLVLHMCHYLRKYTIRDAPLLSDLAFLNIGGVVWPLVELRLQSCRLITSEAVVHLAASSHVLEVLDTNGCRNIADRCLEYVSRIGTLTWLNLGGANITDSGLRVLSEGDLPITNLSLRGCFRVTDRGVISLIKGGKRIRKMLVSLDVGNMPGVSDRVIRVIASSCEAITDLCMRDCLNVTDVAFVTLANGRGTGGSKFIQRLDVYNCSGLSEGVMELLQRPLFRGLKWLGIGRTELVEWEDYDVIYKRRPWLTVCNDGCELGCHDGWQFHNA